MSLEDLLDDALLDLNITWETVPASSNDLSEIVGGGVYLFSGEDDLPLYVGISDNLRRRITTHLIGGWLY